MDRRGFLGSVIGLVGASPFLAKEIFAKAQHKSVFPFKFAFVMDGDHFLIQAPGIVSVEKVGQSFIWKASPLNITQTASYKGIALFTDKNELLVTSPFSSTVPVCSGDSLKAEYTLTTDMEVSMETVVAYLRRFPIQKIRTNG